MWYKIEILSFFGNLCRLEVVGAARLRLSIIWLNYVENEFTSLILAKKWILWNFLVDLNR